MELTFAPRQIEFWPIERLRPYARNAKMHGPDQVARIAASMARFGWTVPCMVGDDGELIAGHGRVLAATELGLAEVPVIRLGHLDEAERRAYRIADNKLTELGDWDEALLRDEIAGLLDDDFDLSLPGFAEDDVPEPPTDPASVPGDLWRLEQHQLICGDSTSVDVVATRPRACGPCPQTILPLTGARQAVQVPTHHRGTCHGCRQSRPLHSRAQSRHQHRLGVARAGRADHQRDCELQAGPL